MDQSRKQMIGAATEGIVNVQFTDKEVAALVDILNFTKDAANLLTKREIEAEVPNKASVELLLKISRHSKIFAELLVATTNIGTPANDEIN